MRIHEVSKQLGLTKRAIKFYEEQGLLKVNKDKNGYRNYSEEDLVRLKQISVCRRLGIGVADTKRYLTTGNDKILKDLLKEKQKLIQQKQDEIAALQAFIDHRDIDEAYTKIDYKNIAEAIKEAVPGFYGYYFMNHFMPYLQGTIGTDEQQEAYDAIVDFWDRTKIKIPLVMRLTGWLTWKISTRTTALSVDAYAKRVDAQTQGYLHPDTKRYNQFKRQIIHGYRIKKLFKYHPVFIAQRKFMKELQNKGYNDVFIPNMSRLSPAYKKYHDALMQINDKICQELGLYYDADFNLVRK